jgi:TatD DNase family protein
MYIDTHCHLNFKDFQDDFLEVAKRSLDNNVYMIVVGSEFKTSERAIFLSEKFDKGVYSAVGLHPIHLQDFLIKNDNENGKYEFKSRGEKFDSQKYQELIDKNKKIVAIGEIGLDYYHINTSLGKTEKEIKDLQKKVFLEQLNLAKKNNLPVIIHCREAHNDLYEILKDFSDKNNFSKDWGVVHCFSGDYELAKKYFSLGLKISFTGLITFVNDWDEVIEKSPIEKLMIETDSPYLSPIPYRGQRNEPLYVKKVAEKIAKIKNVPLEELEKLIFKNSLDFFSKIKI